MQVLSSHQQWELLGQILYMLRHHSECSLATVLSLEVGTQCQVILLYITIFSGFHFGPGLQILYIRHLCKIAF